MIKSGILILLFLFSVICGNLYAQKVDEPLNYKVVNIDVKGNKQYDKQTIISYSGLVTGREMMIPSDESRDAIKKLWNLGLFSDIKLYVDKTFGQDAYVVIEVEELPRIENIQITGNNDMSKEDIESKINIGKGEVLSDQKLKDIEYTIKKYYSEEGYTNTEVTADKLLSSSNEARVRIKIKEGGKLSVQSISFSGNRSVSASDLKSAMEDTNEKVWWKFWDGAKFDREKYEKDKKLILDKYHELGYRDAVIIEDNLKPNIADEDIRINIKVDEGKKYKVNSVKFTGNKIYSDSLLLARLDLKKGDVYNQKKLNENLFGNKAENDISSVYYDNGYLAFSPDVQEKVVNGNKIDLTVDIKENNQYRFGLITFEGNDKTKEKVLRRELYTLPGEYFNRTLIRRSIQQLNALNYFNPEKLDVETAPQNDTTVNIKYIVEEKSSDQFNASVGYSESFGLTGSLGLTFNNFDITQPITGGGGQVLNFNWQFGEGGTFKTFTVGFQEPWLFNTPTTLGFNVYDNKQSYTYEIKETGATMNIGRRFKFPDDYFRGDWTLKYQRTNVLNGGGLYETGIRNQLSIGQTITRSTVFDPIFPVEGTRVVNSTELAGGPFLPGNTKFIKNTFNAEAYNEVVRNTKLTLYTNFNFSFINSLASDNYLPPNELFFMGGNGLSYNTIALRGYNDRNVGPKNDVGTSIGGRVAIKYGLELRYPLSLSPIPIFVLAFAEAGNIWSDIKKTDPFDLRKSVGIGTRLMLPAVGMIGFDFGYGFNRRIVDNEDPKWIFHFQFGKGF
jgi:outer membrane protein insertion porin family